MAKKSRTAAQRTTIIFVRHGKTPTTGKVLPGRAKGLHLSDEGRLEAQAVADTLAAGTKNIDALYASPLERTRETAAPIAKAFGLKVQADKGFLECDFGEWTGAELKALAKLPEWKTVQNLPSAFRFPGGESFLEMQARTSNAIAVLGQRHQGQTIVVVSHADPIKTIAATAMGVPLDLFQRIAISTCSMTIINYGDSPMVLAVNVKNVESLLPQ